MFKFPFAAFLWGLAIADYSWLIGSATAIPVLYDTIRRLRKRMLRLKARSLWLEEDIIP